MPSATDPCLAIFDHDGVLVDTLELHQQAWLALGRQTGLPVTAELIRETFGMTNPMIFRKLLGDTIFAEDVKRFGDLKEACYRDLARGTVVLGPDQQFDLAALALFVEQLEEVRLAIHHADLACVGQRASQVLAQPQSLDPGEGLLFFDRYRR